MINNWKVSLAIVIVIAMAVFIGWYAFVRMTPKAGASYHPPFTPVTLCHATGSKSNPFVEITVSTQGALNGHLGHDGDIIPKGEGDCPGPVDVCKNIEGVQVDVPEGYTKDGDNCYPVQPPKDYCDTLEGVQAEDVDCPVDVCENLEGVQTETPEGYVNNDGECTIPPVDVCPNDEGVQTSTDDCTVTPPPVVKHHNNNGSKCEEPRDITGFRYMFVGPNNRLRWDTQDSMPKVDIKVFAGDKTTFLYNIRTKDDGEEMVPGHVNWYKIRGVNACGLGDWSRIVN